MCEVLEAVAGGQKWAIPVKEHERVSLDELIRLVWQMEERLRLLERRINLANRMR